MPKLRVHNFSVSLDGYGAGPDQSRKTPWVLAGRNSTTGCSRLAPGTRCPARRAATRGWMTASHLAYAPRLLGSGERLFDGLDNVSSGYEIAEFVGTPAALHVRFVRNS